MPNEKSIPVSFEVILTDLLKCLKGTPVIIIGGVAVSLLGRPRYTQDIDILVILENEKWGDLIDLLIQHGFVSRIDNALQFAQKNRVLLMKHAASGIDIDISFGALPFEEECISRSIKVKFGNINLPIPSPEDLIIMKAVAHRPRDLEDIRTIVDSNPDLDKKRIEKWVRAFADVLEMPEIWKDVKKILFKTA